MSAEKRTAAVKSTSPVAARRARVIDDPVALSRAASIMRAALARKAAERDDSPAVAA